MRKVSWPSKVKRRPAWGPAVTVSVIGMAAACPVGCPVTRTSYHRARRRGRAKDRRGKDASPRKEREELLPRSGAALQAQLLRDPLHRLDLELDVLGQIDAELL